MIWQPSLKNYISLFTSYTVQYLALKTLRSVLRGHGRDAIAYPLAFYISRRLTRGKALAALLIVIPLWISLLMRIFAWRVILGERGLLNSLLLITGLADKPSQWFLYTTFAVVLTLTTIAIPYVFIAAYTAIERVPQSLVEAARDNGASAFRTFTTVIWPLTRQGTAIGFALAMLIAVGDFVTGDGRRPQRHDAGSRSVPVRHLRKLAGGGCRSFWSGNRHRRDPLLDEVARHPDRSRRRRATARPSLSRLSGAGNFSELLDSCCFCCPMSVFTRIGVIGMFSFNDSTVQALPWTAFTWKWYQSLPGNRALLDAMAKLPAGSAGDRHGSLYRHGIRISARRLAKPLLRHRRERDPLPGSAGRRAWNLHGDDGLVAANPPGFGRLLLGHLVFVMPVILLVVSNRLRRVDPNFAPLPVTSAPMPGRRSGACNCR